MGERSIFLRLSCFGAVLFVVGRAVSAFEVPVTTIASIINPADLNASECSGGITTFRACSSMISTLSECNSRTGLSAQADCFCRQDVFNLFYGCENEARLCLESSLADTYYEQEVDYWHSACDSLISFSVTTPIISSLSATLNLGACGEVYKDCISGGMERSSCSSSATATIDLLSCMCQPRITSLYSLCLYDTNVSCEGKPGNTDAILGHSFCSRFQNTAKKSLQPSELTSALDMFGFSTWEIVGSTQATTSGASGDSTFNTITSKPVVPIVTTGSSPTGSQNAGSDRIIVSSFSLIIALLVVSLLLSPFI